MKRKHARIADWVGVGLSLLALMVIPATMRASGLLGKCHKCGKECEMHMLVEKTIMVPTKVIETRVQSCLVETMEEREEKYTAFRLVPDKREYTKQFCYLEDEVKTKTITEKHCKLVDVPLTILQKVQVPEFETVERVRTKEICTKCGPQCVCEVCEEEVARLHEEFQASDSCKKVLVFEEVTRDIFYCVKTPKHHTVVCTIEESYRLEPVEKTRTVKVCVPKFEKRPVEVTVTKNLPKKIMCCVKCK